MMDKKLELKRLIIFLVLTFGMTWLFEGAYIISGFRWDAEDARTQAVGMGMLFPFIANILTRYITKEGYAFTGKDSLMLGINFKDKKWIFYLVAMFLPWIIRECGYLIILAVVPNAFDAEYYLQLKISKGLTFAVPIATVVSATIFSFAALGEEGGWRGYMMPKLIKLMGVKKAVVVGGILWGLWHAPLTCIGHNFGTDYPGFPYLGILIMCVFCVFMGMTFTYITIKTESIWPATIMHAVNNGMPGILLYYLNGEIVENALPNVIVANAIMFAPVVIAGTVCMVIMSRKKAAV